MFSAVGLNEIHSENYILAFSDFTVVVLGTMQLKSEKARQKEVNL